MFICRLICNWEDQHGVSVLLHPLCCAAVLLSSAYVLCCCVTEQCVCVVLLCYWAVRMCCAAVLLSSAYVLCCCVTEQCVCVVLLCYWAVRMCCAAVLLSSAYVLAAAESTHRNNKYNTSLIQLIRVSCKMCQMKSTWLLLNTALTWLMSNPCVHIVVRISPLPLFCSLK